MRHQHGYRKLGRTSSHRRALLRNMATSLVLNECISTTLPKAKELRGIIDHLITLGKRGDLHARRQAAEYFFDKGATSKVFADLASRFKDRPGGYTRILKRGARFGDGAKLATIEFVDFDYKKREAELAKAAEAAAKDPS